MNTIFSQTDSKQLKTSRSRSPAAMMGIHIGKRIGGPAHANQNFMMQVTRDARKRLYAHETESAQLNCLGPGPAEYLKENADRQRFGERDRFSIPKVSQIQLLFLNFNFFTGKSRHRPEKRKHPSSNIAPPISKRC